MSDRPTPTAPGAYYLEDGRPAVVARQGGTLWAKMAKPDGYRKDSRVDAMEETWATDPTGAVERVPTLEEWRAVRARIRGLEAPGECQSPAFRRRLRSPPRPLPDGPGWWWARWSGATEHTPTWVGGVGMAMHSEGFWADVTDADELTWLAGPDGRAVRCVPPEVDRG